jgi:hypothetical protein
VIATEATVQQVEELFRADRGITKHSVATALGCSHGIAYNIMHDRLKFRKVWARWVPREPMYRGKKLAEWICLYSISYGMEM